MRRGQGQGLGGGGGGGGKGFSDCQPKNQETLQSKEERVIGLVLWF